MNDRYIAADFSDIPASVVLARKLPDGRLYIEQEVIWEEYPEWLKGKSLFRKAKNDK